MRHRATRRALIVYLACAVVGCAHLQGCHAFGWWGKGKEDPLAAGTVVKVEAATAAAKQPGTDSAAQGTTATAAAAAATTAAASTTGGAGSTNGSTPATSQAQTDTGLLAQGQATGPAQNQGGREREMCMNTCNRARNGVCEEGRPGLRKPAAPAAYLMAYCDLGTDCDDCGPWKTSAPSVPWEDPKVVGPVRFLQSKDVQVRVRAAVVPPECNFTFAYTDPKQDYDVSYHMETSGVVEAGITEIAYKVLQGRCEVGAGRRNLFVDVGANFGWFAILAAKLGCRVIGYEPIPVFRAFFEFSAYLNNVMHLVDIRSQVVSHERGKTMKMVVPARGIWGTAGIDGLNIDRAIESSKEELDVPSVRLEDEVKEDVLLLKIDVEGWEWSVVKGAEGLLKGHKVENVIMEYSPGVPERHFRWDAMLATPTMLVDLVQQHGYRIGHIGDAGKHMVAGWSAPLAKLREVTMQNLKYDVEDIKRWKEGKLGCPPYPALQQKFEMWRMCGGVPEELNPRSLRSEIGHNTNVWASKNGAMLKLEGVSGIFHPDDPADKYFQTNPNGFGMGSRPCMFLDAKVLVKHRCNCTKEEVCGEEARLALQAAKEGLMPQNYVLP